MACGQLAQKRSDATIKHGPQKNTANFGYEFGGTYARRPNYIGFQLLFGYA